MVACFKDWFEDKKCAEFGVRTIVPEVVIKETEKAVYTLCFTGYNCTGSYASRKCIWAPKSVIEDLEKLPVINDYEKAVAYFEMNS